MTKLTELAPYEERTDSSKLINPSAVISELEEISRKSERHTAQDAAVNILDTLQSIASIPLAAAPGHTLQDAVERSRALDEFRSPAFLAERARDEAKVAEATAEGGELAGLTERVSRVFSGNNLGADLASQLPYVAIGPVAKAMGSAAKVGTASVLSRVATGTETPAVVNRIAALSGVLEGSGAYGQTYQRALAETGDAQEALRQARLAGAFSLGLGAVLGKVTPGFELDPLGIKRGGAATQFLGDALVPTATAVGAEMIEEGGMALGQTMADNVLAGRPVMEGTGGAVGEALAISSAFTAGMRSPGLIRDTSKALGMGVLEGLKSVGSVAGTKIAAKATLPEAAATAAAAATVETPAESETPALDLNAVLAAEGPEVDARFAALEKAIPLSDAMQRVKAAATALEGEDDPATWRLKWAALKAELTAAEQSITQPTGSPSEPTPIDTTAASTADKVIEEALNGNTNTEGTTPEAPAREGNRQKTPIEKKEPSEEQYQLNLEAPPIAAPEDKNDPVVAATNTVLAAAAIERDISKATTEADEVEAITRAGELTEVGKVEEAQETLASLTDQQITEHAQKANQGDAKSQAVIEAVSATDITRVPDKALPTPLRKVVNTLQTLREKVAKRAPRSAKVQEVSEQILESGFETNGKKRKLLRGIQQYVQDVLTVAPRLSETDTTTPVRAIQNLSMFMSHLEARGKAFQDAIDKLKNDKSLTSVEVEGTNTLGEDGKLTGKPFVLWPNRTGKDGQRITGSMDVAQAVLEDVADARAEYDAIKAAYPHLFPFNEEKGAKQAAVIKSRQESRKAAQAAEEKKAEAKTQPKAPEASFTTSGVKVGMAAVKRLVQAGVTAAKVNGTTLTVPEANRELAQTILAEEEAKLATPPPPPAAPATPAPTASVSAVVEKTPEQTKEEKRQARNARRRELRAQAKAEAQAERDAIKAVEAAAEARLKEEQAANDRAEAERRAEEERETRAEDEARRAYEAEAEARLAREDSGEEPAGIPDDGVDSDTAQESATSFVRNALLEVKNWLSEKWKDAFKVKEAHSLDDMLAQLNEADRQILDSMANKILAKMPQVMKAGFTRLTSDEQTLLQRAFGVASHWWLKNPDGTLSVPPEVLRAYAYAAAVNVVRIGARYEGVYADSGVSEELHGTTDATAAGDAGLVEIRREAYPAAWANEIARDAMLLLGLKPNRTASLTFTQGLPRSYGLMALQAIIEESAELDPEKRTFQLETHNGEVGLKRVVGPNGRPTQVIELAEQTLEDAKKLVPMIDRVMKKWGGQTVYEASAEPITDVDGTIQFTNIGLSERIRIGLANRQKVAHYNNRPMQQLLEILQPSGITALLTGYYGSWDKKALSQMPPGVAKYLNSLKDGWGIQISAANEYEKLTENGTKPIFMKYHIGLNNRAKSIMGPQSYKLIRDLYSSAYEMLNLSPITDDYGNSVDSRHMMYLKMTIAQAFGVKTDVLGPTEVLAAWEEIRQPFEEKARKLHTAMKTNDAAAVRQALKQDKAWSPRELNALITLGNMLEHGTQPGFANYLPFEIDGKTNGAFNTELFFGLGVRTPVNLEQGGMFLDKENTSWEAERKRVSNAERFRGSDLYERINRAALPYFLAIRSKPNAKGKVPLAWRDNALSLLVTVGLASRTSDGSWTFERLAGKTGAIPVQYGAGTNGIKSQLWQLASSNLIKSYLKQQRQIDRAMAKVARLEQTGTKETLSTAQAELKAATTALNAIASEMDGMNEFNTPFERRSEGGVRWHYALGTLAASLKDGYAEVKPGVIPVTNSLVNITNLAFAMKKVQWNRALAEARDANEAGPDWALGSDEYQRINDKTLNISFSTQAGKNIVSLNHTEFANDSGSTVPGFGTNLEGNLDIPAPKPPGVSVLAKLTIGAGDAAMGAMLMQVYQQITDVFDGIEWRVSEFMQGGVALNEAVWSTAQFDVLRDFHRLLEDMQQLLEQNKNDPEFLKEVVQAWNKVNPLQAFQKDDDFRKAVMEAKTGFQTLYAQQRQGWRELTEGRTHTIIQMGGGLGATVKGDQARDNLDELSLVEDEWVEPETVDLSQTGRREDGLYPDQYKQPGSTRTEDEQGLIDVNMTGERWSVTNIWNSLKAEKGAGIKRLLKMLQQAADAGKPMDSDRSVHPSALKMYIRAIDAGLIIADYSREEVNEAIATGTVLRRDRPIFRSVRLTSRAQQATPRSDSALRTFFDVRNGRLDRAGVIAALDQVRWPSRIQQAVWKRIRNLLPADLMVHLAMTEEQWNTLREEHGHTRRFGSVNATAINSNVTLAVASPEVMLHEVIHTIFTRHLSNYFSNINLVPVELRGPINDLLQLSNRFKSLQGTGRVAFIQSVMRRLEFQGNDAAALDEMLTYVISDQSAIAELSPGFITRVVTRVRQILSRFIRIDVPPTFLDEVMGVFHQLATNLPSEPRYDAPMYESMARDSAIDDLDEMSMDAFVDLFQRMVQDERMTIGKTFAETFLPQIQTKFNLTVPQQQMFNRLFTVLRVGKRPPELEEFVSTTLPKHALKNLFNGAPDVVASVMALAAVDATFAAQLETIWVQERADIPRLRDWVDRALNNARSSSVQEMIDKALKSALIDREYNNSYLGLPMARLDRLGSTVMEKIGDRTQAIANRMQNARLSNLTTGISALLNEKSAEKFGNTLIAAVNTHTDQRWLQDLMAAVMGTLGDGKYLYRAHNELMSAIQGTRALFDTTLPKTLKKLFPADFDGWHTLFKSFGRLDVAVLGTAAREMYLNDAERQRMITVLEAKVNNWVDAKNLGYYLVHRDVRPGSAQPLLRNARAIADNLNGQRQTASDALVADVDQLVTLYAIDFLTASERATVGKYFTQHSEAMNNLIGMLQKVKEAEQEHFRNEYRYAYWKDSLPLSVDSRASIIVAGAIKGAALEQLGYKKGARYRRTPGDPASDFHYYTRDFAPPPVFTQGVIATVRQTGMGVNYQTAASITPEVGTMIADPRLVDYIKTNQGIESNLIPIYNLDGDVVGYERMLDPAIVHKTMKADNTLLHISIGKKLGRITEENMARSFNKMAIQLLVKHWEEGRDAHREGEYEAVNSSTDKQVARAWEVVPADMKAMLEDAFDGQVMIRREMISNTLGYYQPGLLEVYTGDASIDPKTRKIIFGLAQTFMGPKSLQITLAAESAVKELVAGAKDTIIVRSLSVPWNNFQAGATLVVANGVPVTKMVKWYQQGMREIRAYTRLQREVIELTVKIAGTADSGEKDRLRTLQVGKLAQQKRLSIYPLIQAGDLSDLPEGLEENVSHSFFSDISGWVNNHVREKIHPKAPAIMANVLFMRDSELHDAMSKAIQAGDFLARYAIYMHMVESGASSEDARDTVRDELVSYQTNPGRLRAGLEAYGMIWWSQFTIRAQAVMLRRFRKNPFSFFVAQGLGGMVGMPGPLDMSLTERGWDTSVGPDNIISAPSAYIWAKVF